MRLAIVIPTLNEQAVLDDCLASAHQVLDVPAGDLLVVADGGSTDRTVELAELAGALVAVASAGRGAQLNAGARLALARGADALLFLHADTRLHADARPQIAQGLANGAVGGGFTIRFDSDSALLTLGERLVNARTRAFKVPLGDQAQFANAAAFRAAEGFPCWPILEDLELLRRLRRLGKLSIIDAPVVTSARRFEQRGVVRTVVGNWLIWALFAVGFEPHRLARLYRHVR